MTTLSSNISEKIKELRQKKGLNQATLAIRAGLTRSYISLIESGKKIPAVSSLSRIAGALGVRTGVLFEDEDAFIDPNIVPLKRVDMEKQLVREQSDYSAYVYVPLASEKPKKIMDPFFVKIRPGQKDVEETFMHSGEEFNYIIEGKLELTYGEEKINFEKGDCFYFNSSIRHKLKVVGENPVYMVSVNAATVEKDND